MNNRNGQRDNYGSRFRATRRMTITQIVSKLEEWSISATRCPDDSVSALMYEAAYRLSNLAREANNNA